MEATTEVRVSADLLSEDALQKGCLEAVFSLERAFAPPVTSSTSVAVAIDDCPQNTGSNPQGDTPPYAVMPVRGVVYRRAA